MTCHCCNDARPDPAHYRLFADGCLHCAARRIQYLQRVLFKGDKPQIVAKRQERCSAAMAQAVELGLSAKEIRAMAKRAEWQLAPVELSASLPRSG